MHEFLLFAHVPLLERDQKLQILAGLTAMQPVKVQERHLIYQQRKTTFAAVSKKGANNAAVQAPKLGYHKLRQDLRSPVGDELTASSNWTLRAETTPEPGVKNVISRAVSERVLQNPDLERFGAGSEWYRLAI